MGGLIDPRPGRQLAQARRLREMSQQSLAEAVGVHLRTVGNWETGRIGMRIDVAKKVARVLDCEFVCEFVLPSEDANGQRRPTTSDQAEQAARSG
jgi:DNA-binding XRE family transcriptional regulator